MPSIEALVNRQVLKWELEQKERTEQAEPRPQPPPIVTISRQKGSRGSYLATRLAEKLGYQRLHGELIDHICKSSGYRKRIVESLDSQFRSNLELLTDSLLTGQSVDYPDYFRHLCRVALSASRLGGVVLLGRGAAFILGPQRGFHLRVTAPRENREANLIKYRGMSTDQASREIDTSDKQRRAFVAKLLGADIDDPNAYDMTINTSLMDVEDIVEAVRIAIDAKFAKLTHLAQRQN